MVHFSCLMAVLGLLVAELNICMTSRLPFEGIKLRSNLKARYKMPAASRRVKNQSAINLGNTERPSFVTDAKIVSSTRKPPLITTTTAARTIATTTTTVPTTTRSSTTTRTTASTTRGPARADYWITPLKPIATRLWTLNKPAEVMFVYSQDFTPEETSAIQVSVQEIQKYSCIPLTLLAELEADKRKSILPANLVFIARKSIPGDCYSDVGMKGGIQIMRLNPDRKECIQRGIIMHEILHTLGYDHEHSRPDRDEYVNVFWNNVDQAFRHNFDINKNSVMVAPYDYKSIMHYGAYAFNRKKGVPTMEAKRPGFALPPISPHELTSADKRKIRAITGCPLENERE